MYPPSKDQLSAVGVESEATGRRRRSPPVTTGDGRFLDDRINTLKRDATETTPAQEVYRTASAIMILVRNKLSHNKDSVELSEFCSNMCETLKTAMQGKGGDDLSEPASMGLKELERLTSEIERTLKRWANAPHTEYDKEEVDGHKLEIQQILGTLTVLLNGNVNVGERGPNLAPANPHGIATTSVSGESAFGLLIRRAFDPYELPPLVEAVFSSKGEREIVRSLSGDNAQTFVDVIDEALDGTDLSSQTRKKCLKSLYRVCRRHALLPKALKIPLCYDRTGVARYRGGFADVWKGEHCGREVAVKVLRTYSDSNLKRILGKFCKEVVTWKALRHPNVLPLIGVTMFDTQFAMVSEWMVNGNINDFVKAHPDANRIELMGEVTRGLIYIHSQEMCHGDLKGTNILIDKTGHARLADFGLLTIISDPTSVFPSSSYTQGGTARWMSPELIAPQRFGLQDSRPTKSSDCYALGMVIYETISGHLPFHKHPDLVVFMKVSEGERPPREVRFADSLWKMLELCWADQPNARPNIEDVLQYLEGASQSWEPPSSEINRTMGDGGDQDTESYSFGNDPSDYSCPSDNQSFLSTNSENLYTRTPFMNAFPGDGDITDGPILHTAPTIPVSGRLPSAVPFTDDPTETYPDGDHHSLGSFSGRRMPFPSFRVPTVLVGPPSSPPFHSPADHPYTHNQNQTEGRNEHNDHLNDPNDGYRSSFVPYYPSYMDFPRWLNCLPPDTSLRSVTPEGSREPAMDWLTFGGNANIAYTLEPAPGLTSLSAVRLDEEEGSREPAQVRRSRRVADKQQTTRRREGRMRRTTKQRANETDKD